VISAPDSPNLSTQYDKKDYHMFSSSPTFQSFSIAKIVAMTCKFQAPLKKGSINIENKAFKLKKT
jgi:hypothetical protein